MFPHAATCSFKKTPRILFSSPKIALASARKAYAAKAFQKQYSEKMNVHLL